MDELQNRKQDFCAYKTTLDAAVGSEKNPEQVYLFTSDHFFEYNLQTTEFLNVQKIHDKWPNLESDIDAGCIFSNDKSGGYLFIKDQDIFVYSGENNPFLVNKSSLNDYTIRFGITLNDDDAIGCMTCYCIEGSACKIILVFKNTHHKVISCDFDKDSNLENCMQLHKIPPPSDVSNDLLYSMGECEAISYTAGPRKPSTVLYVDPTEVHFWDGNNKKYTKKIADIFECFSAAMLTVVFGSVLCVTLIVIVIAGVFVMTTKKKTSMGEDATVVTGYDTTVASKKNSKI
ncbi:hypothetical protein B4U80_12921 [Leptotrombidium deliense]|uniref:Uncharacterized protein n=1 Tax=Leptotrombidium deliense TaxID=299467 RepID=A0A443SVE1_9ACAR|nr:hypothetical protein B4U80_12921 [Leptotrombidium deliense]